MKVKDLKPNERNPRKISEQRLEMLKKSLAKFGDLSGVIFNRRDQKLVGGHQRVSILPKDAEVTIEKSYDSPTAKGTVAEGYIVIEGERFKYREVDWDKKTAKAALIAANRHRGEWDIEMLKAELSDLQGSDIGSEILGFDENEIMSLIGGPAPSFDDYEGDKTTTESTQSIPPQAYANSTPSTSENQISTEPAQPPSENQRNDAFNEVEEKTEIEGKRHVIIIDCPDNDTKVKLKERLRTEIISDYGAKIF